MIELRKGDFIVTSDYQHGHVLLGTSNIARHEDLSVRDKLLINIPPKLSAGVTHGNPPYELPLHTSVVTLTPFYTRSYYRDGVLVTADRIEGVPMVWNAPTPNDTTVAAFRSVLINAGILRDPTHPHDLIDVLVERGGSSGFDHFAFLDMVSALHVEDQAAVRRMIMYMSGMVR